MLGYKIEHKMALYLEVRVQYKTQARLFSKHMINTLVELSFSKKGEKKDNEANIFINSKCTIAYMYKKTMLGFICLSSKLFVKKTFKSWTVFEIHHVKMLITSFNFTF